MELSENDKKLIHAKKEDIWIISDQIFDLLEDYKKNKKEIIRRMNQILNNLSTILNYSNSNSELIRLRKYETRIEMIYDGDLSENVVKSRIQKFCAKANSITISINEESNVKIQLAENIENLSVNPELNVSIVDLKSKRN